MGEESKKQNESLRPGKHLVLVTLLITTVAGVAVVPAAGANSQTICWAYICATAAASANFQDNPKLIPDSTTYFCGWAGHSFLPPVGGGTATGGQGGDFSIDQCTGICGWGGQSGCGDQGSYVSFGSCAFKFIHQDATAKDLLFSAIATAWAMPNCTPHKAQVELSGDLGAGQTANQTDPTLTDLVKLRFLEEMVAQNVTFANPIDIDTLRSQSETET